LNLERSTNNLSKRLEILDSPANGGNGGKASNGIDSSDDDEYYLTIGSEPDRFAYYRYIRVKYAKDEWRKKTCEAAYDSVTKDELDYSLKRNLRMTPEQRYEQKKRNYFFHLDECSNNGGCVPECRYYPKYGRIEQDEVTQEHTELVECHRQRNDIVNIEINPDSDDCKEFLKIWDNLRSI
jgi:hypothetical protein